MKEWLQSRKIDKGIKEISENFDERITALENAVAELQEKPVVKKPIIKKPVIKK